MTKEQAEKIAKQIASDYAKYQNTSWSLVEAITEALTATSVKVPEIGEKHLETELWLKISYWKPYLHFCPEFDGLLIDKGDLEFKYCKCFPEWAIKRMQGND